MDNVHNVIRRGSSNYNCRVAPVTAVKIMVIITVVVIIIIHGSIAITIDGGIRVILVIVFVQVAARRFSLWCPHAITSVVVVVAAAVGR